MKRTDNNWEHVVLFNSLNNNVKLMHFLCVRCDIQ